MSSLAVCRSAAPSFSGLVQLTGQLYLSNSKAAADGARVSACRISCIVNATEKAKTVPVPGVEYLRVSVADSPDAQIADHFESVADKIRDVAEGGGRTLVHCSAGVSRSAALCLAYLMRHRHMTLEEAHRWVKALRPIIRPNPGFWKQLIAYELKIYGKNTVKMIESPIGEVPDVYEKETRDFIPC